MQSPVRFNMVPEKVWCRARLVQQGSKEGSGEGFRKPGGKPSQVQQGSGEGKVWEAFVQSQVRFNSVPEKVPEKVPGSLGAKPSQVQRGQEKVAEQVFGAGRAGQGFQRSASQHASERCVIIKQCGCWGYHRRLILFGFWSSSLLQVYTDRVIQ